MAANLTASSITVFSPIKLGSGTRVNTQSVPLARVTHLSPSPLGNTGTFITAYQLMNGAIQGSPTIPLTTPLTTQTTWTMPTAQSLLAAYAGNQFRVNVGDVFKVAVINNGGTGLNINTVAITGATGGFVANSGTQTTTIVGLETPLHIQWLAVSADGNTGAYQIY